MHVRARTLTLSILVTDFGDGHKTASFTKFVTPADEITDFQGVRVFAHVEKRNQSRRTQKAAVVERAISCLMGRRRVHLANANKSTATAPEKFRT